MSKSILIAEDDTSLLPLLAYNLKNNGFKVIQAKNGEEALLALKENLPDLLLLDWMMPSPNGIEICKILRQKKETKNIPIIMLTAKSEEDNKIVGLESGADDYIIKPFSTTELVARIKALLRRSYSTFNVDILEYKNLKINVKEYRTYRNDRTIHLGPKEFKLLKYLMENPGRVFSREQLLNAVWGHGIFVELRTVDTHIRRLRKSINLKGEHNLIRTVRSAGYSLD